MQTIAQRPAPHPSGSQAATIRLQDLELVLATHKIKQTCNRKLAQFCALSEGPTIQVDCGRNRDIHRRLLEQAKRFGLSRARMVPMNRGGIARRIQQTRDDHGLAEVRKTWGAGIRALLAENIYLNGGAA